MQLLLSDKHSTTNGAIRQSQLQSFSQIHLRLTICRSRPKDKKNDDSVSLRRGSRAHYIHKVDEKTDVDTDVDLKTLPHCH